MLFTAWIMASRVAYASKRCHVTFPTTFLLLVTTTVIRMYSSAYKLTFTMINNFFMYSSDIILIWNFPFPNVTSLKFRSIRSRRLCSQWLMTSSVLWLVQASCMYSGTFAFPDPTLCFENQAVAIVRKNIKRHYDMNWRAAWRSRKRSEPFHESNSLRSTPSIPRRVRTCEEKNQEPRSAKIWKKKKKNMKNLIVVVWSYVYCSYEVVNTKSLKSLNTPSGRSPCLLVIFITTVVTSFLGNIYPYVYFVGLCCLSASLLMMMMMMMNKTGCNMYRMFEKYFS